MLFLSEDTKKSEEPSSSEVVEEELTSPLPEDLAPEPGKQAEDDVQIEEEKVEEEEEDGSVQPPIATSSLAG